MVAGRRKMTSLKIKYDEMMNPVLAALRGLGGSGTNDEINNKVAEDLGIPAEQLELLHNPEKGGITEFEYRIMWTRTYLKQYGLIDNSNRGVWVLTPEGSGIDKIDPRQVVRFVREQKRKPEPSTEDDEEMPNRKIAWQVGQSRLIWPFAGS
jgi:restriction system protein